jgi:penicillin-binding protein 1A
MPPSPSGGLRVYPYFVTQVDDSGGHVLYQAQAAGAQARRRQPCRPRSDRDALRRGDQRHGRGAAIAGHEAAGKTGTTQDYHDAWFVGFTTDYVAGVWVGNDDSSPMKTVTGGSLPAAIWHDVMTAAERNLPSTPLDKSDLQAAPVDDGTITAGATDNGAPSFWNWVFGKQQPAAPPPAAPAPPQPQKDNDDDDNGH